MQEVEPASGIQQPAVAVDTFACLLLLPTLQPLPLLRQYDRHHSNHFKAAVFQLMD
jgi:hypothetical protein